MRKMAVRVLLHITVCEIKTRKPKAAATAATTTATAATTAPPAA